MKNKKTFYPPIWQYVKRILLAFFTPFFGLGILISIIGNDTKNLSDNYLLYITLTVFAVCLILYLRYSWLNLRVFVVHDYGLSVKRALFWGKSFFPWQDVVSMEVPIEDEGERPSAFILSDTSLKRHEIPYHLPVKRHHRFIDAIEHHSGKTVIVD